MHLCDISTHAILEEKKCAVNAHPVRNLSKLGRTERPSVKTFGLQRACDELSRIDLLLHILICYTLFAISHSQRHLWWRTEREGLYVLVKPRTAYSLWQIAYCIINPKPPVIRYLLLTISCVISDDVRRERDLNPRSALTDTRFRIARLRPLGHLSMCHTLCGTANR